MRKAFVVLFIFSVISFFGQDAIFKIDSVPYNSGESNQNYGLKFPASWRFHNGDDLRWADADFKDGDWSLINCSLPESDTSSEKFTDRGWFRLTIEIDSSMIEKPYALMMVQTGASEIYLDGKLIHAFGHIDPKHPEKEEYFNPQGVPIDFAFERSTKHVLAIRYSNPKHLKYFQQNYSSILGFSIRIAQIKDATFFAVASSTMNAAIFTFYFTFFLALSFLHLVFFLYYRANLSNLYYSIFSGAFGTVFLCLALQKTFMNPVFNDVINNIMINLDDFYSPAMLALLYTVFNGRLPKIFWLWLALYFIDLVTTVCGIDLRGIGILLNAILIVESFRIIITAIIKKKEGAWIIGSGIIVTIAFFLLFFILAAIGAIQINFNGWLGLLFAVGSIYATLSIPISMTVFLARDFSKTSWSLEKKLIEVEELSSKSLEQEKEKQKILESQKETLEQKVTERTLEITEQKKIIEEKNKDITDSINYAKRIQEAMLPPLDYITELLPENFVLYKPKDIVAGDFYWAEVVQHHAERRQVAGQVANESISERGSSGADHSGEKIIFIAAADCTGHGVPGAMVSVVCANALNRAVKEFGIVEPGRILDKVRALVLETFEKAQSQVKDGMDISLCSIRYLKDADRVIVHWAGANNPLWYLHEGKNHEITAHKQSIGRTDDPKPFPTHEIMLNKGDSLFLFTDGYADQFGGEKGKKFKYRQLLDLFINTDKLHMKEVHAILDDTFEAWKGRLEQIDDVCVIGIKL